MMHNQSIPHFFLYEEVPDEVELDFLHVEAIHLRSGMHNWHIHPHAHPEHGQFLFVTKGRGIIRLETEVWQAVPLSLIMIPAGVVHSMEFEPQTDGFVITAADSYIRERTRDDPAMIELKDRPGYFCLDANSSEAQPLADAFQSVASEFVWHGRARRFAIMAHFTRILVSLERLHHALAQNSPWRVPNRNLDIVHRFRRLVETYFREDCPLTFYAEQLHVTHARLNIACRAIAGKSASKILFDRIILEAKRNLLYTSLPIAAVGQAVGLADPAYFCRFFTKRTGISPSEFRENGLSTLQEKQE
ncbi:helix-turn-helix domain-containing protein [Beijerinckia mobilis]|uniref:helix-turn-helix domain-containing protein n=1 Tax=Beijerinckia mobilis TaxID=231434 RepID=UPI0005531639|nr:helix-turn-helix domain-containing protein [Beijerinckia mobilis]